MARRNVYTKTGVTEVGIRELRAELRRWLEHVSDGGEVVVTERGRPIARLIGASRSTRMQEMIDAGLITPAKRPKEPIKGPGLKVRASVSELVSEQRR